MQYDLLIIKSSSAHRCRQIVVSPIAYVSNAHPTPFRSDSSNVELLARPNVMGSTSTVTVTTATSTATLALLEDIQALRENVRLVEEEVRLAALLRADIGALRADIRAVQAELDGLPEAARQLVLAAARARAAGRAISPSRAVSAGGAS